MIIQTQFLSKVSEISSQGTKHIALVVGGLSAEREVSLMSADAIGTTLVALGYRVTRIDMGNDIATVIQNIKPDIVFNGLHGTYGEDGALQGVLNILQIPYTHSGLLASAIAFDKVVMHSMFKANDIPYIDSRIVHRDDVHNVVIDKPYVIKPISQGSSIGVEIVLENTNVDITNYIFNYGDKVIVQPYIKGRELQVAVLNGKALGVLEIEMINGKLFYDYDAKYVEGFANHILPARIDRRTYESAMRISEDVYQSFGCNGIVRVEFIYQESQDKLYVLELNTHPGNTPLSICPEIAAYANISFSDFISALLLTAKYE